MVIRRQFKFWKYLSRYQFERTPIRRRYETKDVSFYARPVPVNDLQQFQSPETESERQSPEKAVCFNVQSQNGRVQSPENDLRKVPENRMVCGVGSTSPVTTVVMIFVKAQRIWWLVYGFINVMGHTCVELRGGFSESRFVQSQLLDNTLRLRRVLSVNYTAFQKMG